MTSLETCRSWEPMYKVGIDVGGTFTDAVVAGENGEIHVIKVPSTPKDLTVGFTTCLKEASQALGLDFTKFLGLVRIIVHGTTITTNTILTMTGAKTSTLTTKGFRDVLELRRGTRTSFPNFRIQVPPMMSPRHLRMEVEERVLSNGEVKTPLNMGDVQKVVQTLKKEGFESVAVCFLFSFLYPEHEKKVGDILHREFPDAYISLSSDVLPQVGEFERTSTTVLNAYVGPPLRAYLTRLEQILHEAGFRGQLLVMESNGGVQSSKNAAKHAVTTVLSGPSAAIPADIFFAEKLGYENIISIDMGGTSLDVGLVEKGRVLMTTDKWINRQRVMIPMLDIHTIGAGGGSVAWMDPSHILRVGPQSSGSEPGPACYGIGGEKPTVTDADLVLGYLNPQYFAGGRIKLQPELSKKAIEKHIASEIGMNVVDAAHAIHKVINENMANAISVVSVRRGYDPRDFVLCAAGGAGPSHAVRLADEVGIPRILVPKMATAYCALGTLLCDLKHSYVRSYFGNLAEIDLQKVNQLYNKMENEGLETLLGEGIRKEDINFMRTADIRYVGQVHEVEVVMPAGTLGRESLPLIANAFHERHQKLYEFADPGAEIEILNLKVAALGKTVRPVFPERPLEGKDPSHALKTKRQVYFAENMGFVETEIYNGDKLQPGNVIHGPAIVEHEGTTLVIPPKREFRVDKLGNYHC